MGVLMSNDSIKYNLRKLEPEEYMPAFEQMIVRKSAIMLSLALMGVFVLSERSLLAETFVLKKAPSSLSDWKDGAFYDNGGQAPTGIGTDVISISPSVPRVEVSGEDSSVVSFLGGISRVICSNSTFSISVESGEVDFPGAIDDNQMLKGVLEKTGRGTLNLLAHKKWSSNGTTHDYEIGVHVKAGTLRLPRVDADTFNLYEYVRVEDGAALITPDRAAFQVRGFWGDGMVTNESQTSCSVLITPNWGDFAKPDFSGVLGGKLSVQVRQGAYQKFSGMASTFPDGVSMGYENGELRVKSFGAGSTSPSSVGKSGTAVSASGKDTRIVYEGAGETTAKNFYLYSSLNTLDSGENGGLVLNGNFPLWNSIKSSTTQRCLVLAGENPLNESVISGKFDPDNYTTVQNLTQWHITKRGAGVWRFTADDHANLSGLFAVENGTLAFDSIAPRGEKCALGTADRTYAFGSEISDATKVNYAYLLGTPTTVGYLQYRGADNAQCTDRPFALAGQGGFLSASGAGRIVYANVTTATSEPGTLVLNGPAGTENAVYDVTNGAGVVSVRKEGEGTWTMGGRLNFTGPLEVNAGTLIVRSPDEYRWYRFVIKEVGEHNAALAEKYKGVWGNTWGMVCFNEIGLYDDEGVRQNIDLVGIGDYRSLKQGEAAYSMSSSYTLNDPRQIIENLFDDAAQATNGSWNGVVLTLSDTVTPSRTDRDHWISVDMRLPDTAHRIVRYDVCSGNSFTGSSGGRLPSAVALYGSADGVFWDLLGDEFDEIADITSGNNYQWMKGNYVLSSGGERGGTKHTGGWSLKKTAPVALTVLPSVGAVTVDNGAILRYEGATERAPVISHLKLKSNATGSIGGFAFAADGVFEVDGLAAQSTSVAIDLSDAKGLDNVASWSVVVGGKAKPNYRVKATADGFVVDKSGLVLIVQ